MSARGLENSKYQGSKWITRQKRLAIYLRDGMACAYCGTGIEDGVELSLDHVTPHCNGGNNHESNLVTCCKKCNSSRGNRSVSEFAEAVANYLNHGITANDIVTHVFNCIGRSLNIEEAKEIVNKRSSWSETLASFAEIK